MKENTIKLGYRPRDVIDALGSKSLYERAVHAGWIAPVIRKHKLVLFDSADIERCWKRIKAGELPPVEPANDKEGATR
jgi:hypothetical protein